MRRQTEVRRSGKLPWLQPDAESQVTFLYRDGQPVAIESVVLSTQHDASVGFTELCDAVERHIIDPAIPSELCGRAFRAYINPTGRFVTGGPKGDTGLTGRKIIAAPTEAEHFPARNPRR